MTHTYHMTRVSGNKKTGPIPVTTSSRSTCPTCPLKDNGCYAESGPLRLHWNKVSDGSRGGTLTELCSEIRTLPKRQLWRWAQAGDLPGDHDHIDVMAMAELVEANGRRQGFAFTHYDPWVGANALAITEANARGFTVNMSANDLSHADELHALGIGPVVVVLPIDQTKPTKTPAGRHVSVCPAAIREDVTCASCGICAIPHRKAILGFPAHGSGAKKAQAMFFMRKTDEPNYQKLSADSIPTAGVTGL